MVHIVTTRLLRPGFVHRAVHEECVVNKLALGQLFLRPLKLAGSLDSVVSKQITGWTIWCSIPDRCKRLSLLPNVRPASYSVSNRGSFVRS